MSRTSPERPALDAPEGCPEVDALAQYAEGVLGDRRRAALDEHVAHCDRCRSLVAAAARAGLVAEGAVGRTPGGTVLRFPRWIPFAAAAVVVVGLALWLPSREPSAEGTDARLVAVAERLSARRPDLFADFRPLDAAERAAGAVDVQRGGIEDMAPAGVTVETRPTFEWAEVDGAAEYALTVIDAEGTRLLSTKVRSARLEGSALAKALTRNTDYVWKVTAVGSAMPAEGTCALRVAGDADARTHASVVAAVAAVADETLRDLATAHALLRRGLAADALPFARRFAAGHAGDDVGRETRALIRRRLAAAAKTR